MGSVEDDGQVYEECMLNEEEYAEEDDEDKGGKETPQYRKVYMVRIKPLVDQLLYSSARLECRRLI